MAIVDWCKYNKNLQVSDRVGLIGHVYNNPALGLYLEWDIFVYYDYYVLIYAGRTHFMQIKIILEE